MRATTVRVRVKQALIYDDDDDDDDDNDDHKDNSSKQH